MNLTPDQQAAVVAGPRLCIKACAGAGKSTVLVERIAYQIQCGFDPQKIIAITFTKKAANELKNKLKKKGLSVGFVGTVHSWALSEINTHHGSMFKAAPAALFERMIRTKISETGLDFSFEACLKSENPLAVGIVQSVRRDLERDGLIDFDQILIRFGTILYSEMFSPGGNRYSGLSLFVDEYQDTAPPERSIYDRFNRITIVGDARQCLYAFRGADPKSMDRICKDKQMEVVELRENFRCSKEIVEHAEEIFSPHDTQEIETFSMCIESEDFLNLVKKRSGEGSKWTILCGYNATVNTVRNVLLRKGIQVQSEARNDEHEKLVAYIAWKSELCSELLFAHASNLCCPELFKRLKQKSTEEFREPIELLTEDDEVEHFHHQAMQLELLQLDYPDLSLQELAELVSMPIVVESDSVKVMTVHAAKGLEWDHVIFVDDLRYSDHHRRMRYVACTRARKELVHIVPLTTP